MGGSYDMTIKLLIVDDSAFMRKIISDLVSDIEGVEVVGIARNGLDALEAIPRFRPDIITLDVEMPKLNGIETLKVIKSDYDIPVIMLSSQTGADITMEALQIGAIDFIEKPSNLKSNLTDLRLELDQKIKSVINKKDIKPKRNRKRKSGKINLQSKLPKEDFQAVVIGASTGGPKALAYIIGCLPSQVNIPIFIVQHMPKNFTTSFAARLDNETDLKVFEAEDGMLVEGGNIYLAPGDYHMTIEKNRISLNSEDKLHGVRPAVDYLFASASQIYGDKLLGIILTGMGKDGADGMVDVKQRGGYNLAQSEESCIVYGMPGSAVAKGVVDEILSLEDMSTKLNQLIRVK